jgi:hypothetical protein
VKFYGAHERLHVVDTRAKIYVGNIAGDCKQAIDDSGFMSHYTDRYRQMLSLKMKNDFLRWWHEYRKTDDPS